MNYNTNLLWIWMLLLLREITSNGHNFEYFEATGNQSKLLKMGDSDKHLLWFVQISDLHLSIFKELERITEFREFCQYTIDAIKPPLVIASGDITDGRSGSGLGTFQIKEEWEHYYNIIKENSITNKTMWLDIRGNHDGFNVISINSQENYFTNYSVQGKNNPRSYFKQLKKDDLIYSFVALDVSLVPGQREPFHFLGYLDTAQVTAVKNIIKHIESTGSNYTLWFGHFPTSATVAQYPGGVRALIGEDKRAYAYLSGHLHNYNDFVPRMFTLHSEGFLELELGDWKSKRIFRLLTYDHGLLSFIDVYHREWPIVLVTNPKHALFMISEKEDLNIIVQSTHIRILVFSLSKIDVVKAKINDEKWMFCKNINGPLYVTDWNPQKYINGLHSIQVIAKDVDGREKYITQPFALDGTKLHFDLSAELSLKVDLALIFKTSFGIAFAISVLPLCVLRCLHKLVKDGIITKPSLKRGCCSHRLRIFWILVTVDRIFWPLLLYPIYLAIGPWLVGYIIEDHWGVIFTWGIFINNSFLPGAVTYDCAAIQLLLFHIPLTIIVANGIYLRFMYNMGRGPGKFRTIVYYVTLHSLLIMVMLFQGLVIYFFLSQFGAAAAVLGPIPTWSTIFAIILWYQTLLLPEKCTREAAKMWVSKLEPEPIQSH